MNIPVVNGSPKGCISITVKTSEYLEILFKEHGPANADSFTEGMLTPYTKVPDKARKESEGSK